MDQVILAKIREMANDEGWVSIIALQRALMFETGGCTRVEISVVMAALINDGTLQLGGQRASGWTAVRIAEVMG